MNKIIVASLVFVGSISSHAASSTDRLTGAEVVEAYAYMCSAKDFSEFYSAVKGTKFMSASIDRTKKDESIVMSVTKGKYSLEAKGKKYEAEDPCALTLAVVDGMKSSANLMRFIIPEAHARTAMISEDPVVTEFLVAVGLAAGTALGTTAAAAVSGPGAIGVAVIGGGATISYAKSEIGDKISTRIEMQSFLNGDFSIPACSSRSLTLESSKSRILFQRDGARVQTTVFDKATNQQRTIDLKKAPRSFALVTAIADRCRSSWDSSEILRDLRNEDIRANVALMTGNGQVPTLRPPGQTAPPASR